MRMDTTRAALVTLLAAAPACFYSPTGSDDPTTGTTTGTASTVDPTTGPTTPGSTTQEPTTASPATDTTVDPPTTTTTTEDPTTTTTTEDPTTDTTTGGPAVVAAGPGKGGPIAVNAAGDTIAVANKATGDVTLFALEPDVDPVQRARVTVGAEPVSVAWSPDGHTLFVVSRRDNLVTRIDAADTAAPEVADPLSFGRELIQGALSPTGARLYVTSWVDGTLTVVDTAGMQVDATLDLGGNPHAVCVTNDGDDSDDDEAIFVTDFYARPIDGEKEGTDAASQGRVFRVAADTGEVTSTFLSPLLDAGIAQAPGAGVYPNQLYACVVNMDHLYVTAVGASPESFMTATDFRQNVHGMIYAIELATGMVDSTRTVVLNALIDQQTAPKRFVAIPTDIVFADNSEFGYVTSLASDSFQRIDYTTDPISVGSPSANFLQTPFSPTGAAIFETRAFVLGEVSRGINVIDLAAQTSGTGFIESAPQPVDPAEIEVLLGQRFFETGLDRWSTNGWLSCAACHPYGTTDNVTWSVVPGPRQTTDVSASFDRFGMIQRVLGWTAIFDEIHDFELYVRSVANGTGAIVNDSGLNADGTPEIGVRIDFVGPGGTADPDDAFNKGSAAAVAASGEQPADWDAIAAYIRSLRSPRGRSNPVGDPTAGRDVFLAANCEFCHGGPLWSSAVRYYDPVLSADASLTTLAAAGVANIGAVRPDQVSSQNTNTLTVIQNDTNGAPHRHTCVVRKVGTFDVDGPNMRGAAELRQNGMPAQGVDGFNVPSLLGMATGAPFLHNGAAAHLGQLLSNNFQLHLQAGNQVFAPSAQELADLIAFVQSIDDDTPTIPVPVNQRFCPVGYVPPVP
jgi:YVTN family beta-propeller protein